MVTNSKKVISHRFYGSHLIVFIIRSLKVVLNVLPPTVWGWVADGLTPLLWGVLSKHRCQAMTNLIATGRDNRTARLLGMASFRSNLLVFLESLAMARIAARKNARVKQVISPAATRAFKRINTGKELMAIALSGHVGVWELMGAEGARLLKPATLAASARSVKDPIINEYLVKLRRSYGLHHVDKEGIIRYVVKMLRQKKPYVYVFLCDQHFRRGEPLPFLDRTACTVTIPATLALKYRCPVFIGRCLRKAPGDYVLEIDRIDLTPYTQMAPEDGARALTQKINDYIGESIELAPEQWTWAHRRWRACCESGR